MLGMKMKEIEPPLRGLVLAQQEAEKSNQRRARMGAIVTTIQAYALKAYNYNIFDARNKNNKHSIHAEEHLIIKAARRGISLEGHTILIYRKKSRGCGTSRPCTKCMELLQKSGIAKIIYYNGNNWVIEQL
jgi:cytidine deaminase